MRTNTITTITTRKIALFVFILAVLYYENII